MARNKGETIPEQGTNEKAEDRVPRMPHERDESADSQRSGEASATVVGKQAHRDVERGLVDTDKGPPMDKTYDKVREGAQDPVKKFRP